MTHRHERQRDRTEGGEGELKNGEERRHVRRERERERGRNKGRENRGERVKRFKKRGGRKTIKRDERE